MGLYIKHRRVLLNKTENSERFYEEPDFAEETDVLFEHFKEFTILENTEFLDFEEFFKRNNLDFDDFYYDGYKSGYADGDYVQGFYIFNHLYTNEELVIDDALINFKNIQTRTLYCEEVNFQKSGLSGFYDAYKEKYPHLTKECEIYVFAQEQLDFLKQFAYSNPSNPSNPSNGFETWELRENEYIEIDW